MKKLIYVVLVVALIGSIANADLVAHYEFEGNGNDSAGSANGTLMGDATYGTGPTQGGKNFGQALSLDGDGDYMDCGVTFASVTASTTKTITAWAKSTTAGYPDDSKAGMVIELYRKSDSSSGFYIRTNSDPAKWGCGYLNTATSVQLMHSTSYVSVNEWVHIALVQNGADISLYIDGQLDNSADDAVAPAMSNPINATIGAYFHDTAYNSFDGLIDDVRIYDHALSQQEIQTIIPEPATFILFSLGGIMLRKKAKSLIHG